MLPALMVAPLVALLITAEKVSLGSKAVSSVVGTVNVLAVSLWAKVSVPLAPVKSVPDTALPD